MTSQRQEFDPLGPVLVDSDRLWGAQTQRALLHFNISSERMPVELIHALASVKRSCAKVNGDLGLLPMHKVRSIMVTTEEIMAGTHDAEFPLSVWQTGSGTQTHMNMNEVLANRASQLLGGSIGELRLVHPNDHVNCSQSTNDIFPTAVGVACVRGLQEGLLPALRTLRQTLDAKARDFCDIVKIGRTHLQDATPLTLGQEISGWAAQLEHAQRHIEACLPHLRELAVGGTAVGTGLNAPVGFGERVAQGLGLYTGLDFVTAPNRFEALAAHDGIVHAHGALKGLAASLFKIANDVRWLASGPRCGLGEIGIPENEPGSSMMPGKVNPTQCEALAMVCIQVFGHDVSIGFAGACGNFELNVCKPLLAFNMLSSIGLLSDALTSFDVHCARGIEPRRARIAELLSRSLMLVTSLAPHIGYDQAALIAKAAHASGSTLREAALASGLVSAADFDRWVDAAAQCQVAARGPVS